MIIVELRQVPKPKMELFWQLLWFLSYHGHAQILDGVKYLIPEAEEVSKRPIRSPPSEVSTSAERPAIIADGLHCNSDWALIAGDTNTGVRSGILVPIRANLMEPLQRSHSMSFLVPVRQ